MTKKDYELIARAMREARKGAGSNPFMMSQWRWGITELANALQEDNPRFDRSKFLKACGA